MQRWPRSPLASETASADPIVLSTSHGPDVTAATPAADAEVGFSLDEAVLTERRTASARRVHTVQIPFIRVIGFAILCGIAALQDLRGNAPFPQPALLLLVAGNLAYAVISWLALRYGYGRTGRLDLSLTFFHLDVLVWLPNLHHLEQSNLFFAYFLLVRVADQVGFGFRRALYFVNVVVLAYLAYAGWASMSEPLEVASDRVGIAAIMYLLGAYLAFTGVVTERLRKRTRQAVRTARERVGRLEQKTRALETQALELDDARRQAEQASVAKSQFLATISHEIRTPLNGVLGTTELLLDTPLTMSQRRYAETAHTSATSLLALINDVLDLSRIEAGKLVLHETGFDLRRLVQEAVDVMAATRGSKPVSLGCIVPPDLPAALQGDPLRLRQLLMNLLHNAIKFTDRGAVELEVTVVEDAPTSVLLCFEVRDTGIGIEADQLDSMFDAFTQADGSSTRRHGGSGLGLSIVRQLAALMGGAVRVDSEVGQGSLFAFDVRLKKALEPTAAAAPAAPLASPVPACVLLAEDDEVNQLVVSEMLKKMDCLVDVVTAGDAACRFVEARRYDVVFMDCQMPGVDGYEATRRIRHAELSTGQRVPIVALTADALSGSRERCIDSGMDDYLTKPISFALLQAAVQRWTRRAPEAAD